MTQEWPLKGVALVRTAMLDYRITKVRYRDFRRAGYPVMPIWQERLNRDYKQFNAAIRENIGLVMAMRLRGDFNAWQLEILKDYDEDDSWIV